MASGLIDTFYFAFGWAVMLIYQYYVNWNNLIYDLVVQYDLFTRTFFFQNFILFLHLCFLMILVASGFWENSGSYRKFSNYLSTSLQGGNFPRGAGDPPREPRGRREFFPAGVSGRGPEKESGRVVG